MIETVLTQDDNHLLLTLREVSDLVAHSQNVDETLGNIVRHIKWRFHTDVCSVYTVDRQSGELVLSATVGLRDAAISCVRMALHEGLTGLVAQTKAPVSVENANEHPRYRYFPETGEEQYRSFLGVPLIQGGELQGVLVVQHIEPRRYSPNETLLLVAVAAQLAILVTNARLTRDLSRAVEQLQETGDSAEPKHALPEIHGTSASPGFAHGKALRFEEFDFSSPAHVARQAGTPEEELARLEAALRDSRDDIQRAAEHLAELLGDQFGALMQAQRLMLDDASVKRDLTRLIRDGSSVESAVVKVCMQYLKAFAKIENPFFYERIYDIKDVFRRLLEHATGPSFVAPAEPVIVVAREVSLLELFSCDLHRVRGIVVQEGGAYSHVAILARSLQIPMLTHASRLMDAVRSGDDLYVDSATAVVYINPDPTRRAICEDLLAAAHETEEDLSDTSDLPIRLEATVNLLPEVARTVHHRAAGVGLYRSEFLELACRYFPAEEEQLEIYRRILRLLKGLPFTMRTLDLRAEKLFGIDRGPNLRAQAWNWRLVDQLPHVQELLRSQLRAALRAANDGPLRILFPMITSTRQLNCALRILEEAKLSLAKEGLPYGENVPVGIMIEVAAAAMMVRSWIPKVDFLCIGSNDMLHSLLGIERNDDELSELKTPLEPSYLRTVRRIVRCAHAAGRPVTICGEAASNPSAILALYALGVDAVSVPPDDLPKVRKVFRQVQPPSNLHELARQLSYASDVQTVEKLLAESFRPI